MAAPVEGIAELFGLLTVFLCTSSPAQLGLVTSMFYSPDSDDIWRDAQNISDSVLRASSH